MRSQSTRQQMDEWDVQLQSPEHLINPGEKILERVIKKIRLADESGPW